MAKAIRIHETGGPEALQFDEIEVRDPGSGEVRLRHTAIGVNFIDTYHRTGLYPLDLPAVIGMEAAGVVEAVGDGVERWRPGDRVGYPMGPPGAYSSERLIPEHRLVEIPQEVDDNAAAALLLKGMTVEYLVRRCFRVQRGQTALVHAAAGGVGLILCQWLKHLGATVIGTMSTSEKAALAAEYGCDHTVLYSQEDFVERVQVLTDGRGVDVVYDGVGKATLPGSLDCLKRRGMCVVFGNASGKPDPVDPMDLVKRGSLYLTRPSLADYIATRAELEESARELFSVVRVGGVRPVIGRRWALEDAAEAHRALEARETSGSTLLTPD